MPPPHAVRSAAGARRASPASTRLVAPVVAGSLIPGVQLVARLVPSSAPRTFFGRFRTGVADSAASAALDAAIDEQIEQQQGRFDGRKLRRRFLAYGLGWNVPARRRSALRPLVVERSGTVPGQLVAPIPAAQEPRGASLGGLFAAGLGLGGAAAAAVAAVGPWMVLPMFVLSIILHEIGHARMSVRLGYHIPRIGPHPVIDWTARESWIWMFGGFLVGRQPKMSQLWGDRGSFHPRTWGLHIDPVLTVLMPLYGLLLGGVFFGVARDLLIDPENKYLRDEVRDRAKIALVGPLVNLGLAVGASLFLAFTATGVVYGTAAILPLSLALLAAAGALTLARRWPGSALVDPLRPFGMVAGIGALITVGAVWLGLGAGASTALAAFVYLNSFLFVFNMLPIYPLDGSHVLRALLPSSWRARYEWFSRRLGATGGFLAIILILTRFPWAREVFLGAVGGLADLLLAAPLKPLGLQFAAGLAPALGAAGFFMGRIAGEGAGNAKRASFAPRLLLATLGVALSVVAIAAATAWLGAGAGLILFGGILCLLGWWEN